MHRYAIAAVLLGAACSDEHAARDAHDEEVAADTAQDDGGGPDVARDPSPDAPPDAVDVPPDTPGEEAGPVCGDLVVEGGEQCDPPGSMTVCRTECASEGSGPCTGECQRPGPEECVPPEERCNRADEDCDGMVDEGTLSAWERVATVAPAGAGATADVAILAEGWAVVWVTEDSAPGSDLVHLAVLDALGGFVLEDTVLELGAGQVSGRPAVTWADSHLLVAWMSASTGRHVARVEVDGTVAAHETMAVDSPGGDVDLAWAGSHAALVWTDAQGGDSRVALAFVDASGADELSARAVSAAPSVPASPRLDVSDAAVAAVWVDGRSGADEVHLSVVDHAGDPVAADAPLTITGGAVSPSVSAEHRLVAYAADREGDLASWVAVLDESWTPAGAPVRVAEQAPAHLASTPASVVIATGELVHTLDGSGAVAGAALSPALSTVTAVAPSDPVVAILGPDATGTDLALALAGCAHFESCTRWLAEPDALATRTGGDVSERLLVHDAAFEGTFEDRPVTYLSVQIHQDPTRGGPTEPSGYVLTGAPTESCGVCVLVYEECSMSACERVYLARRGKIVLEALGDVGESLAGRLVDVQLAEVEIDPADGSSEWVEDGGEVCIGSYEFDELIAGI